MILNDFRSLLARQPALPAPMCGISDFPWRELCRRMGARVTYTQMVSAEALWRGDAKTLEILDLAPGETHVAMQLFGGEPEALAHACRVLQDHGALLIDLNMGCPARKITCSHAGSALLNDLPRVARIFRAMRQATRVPLTAKMRWDWADGLTPADALNDKQRAGAALAVARLAEAEGLDGVCLHARTREQGYSGVANWELIARLKEAVAIPVVGNGDIREPADALQMRAHSGCDGVMIGRALIGDPWLLGDILAALEAGHAAPRRAPDWPTRRALMLEHAALMFERRGPRGLIQFRKHAAAYLRGLRGAKLLRTELMQAATLEELSALLDRELEPAADAA
ncbi:MAG TPA: tRNA-dihydrouridine synthase [Candidatus Sumerlaeota bacterium]|nr:tRNA-dihydrouridine synthase [Candidatus Sumerlaeota bacterium]